MVISAPKGTGALLGRMSNLFSWIITRHLKACLDIYIYIALFADTDVPIEIKDRLSAAYPLLISKRIHQFGMKRVMEVDRYVLTDF